MLFLLQSFAAWIAAALALGLVCGLPAAWAGQGLRWNGWSALLAVVYCSGVAAAALQLAPGRAGFWLETGLLIFGAYALGVLWGGLCAVVLSRLFGRRAGDPAPDWGATARDFTRQADAYAVVARQGASAFDAAAGLLAPAEAAAPPVARAADAATRRSTIWRWFMASIAPMPRSCAVRAFPTAPPSLA